jgi:bifunctional non-homologous end joining protein LigD
MSLLTYNKKRNFKQTAEPAGKKKSANKFRFVVQRHEASHLHYDFRLELGGVLKSWAVPKGPSLNPATKRLAVMVEDHPVDYISFKGIIPAGNYGAGKVGIWDNGNFQPVNSRHEPVSEKEALQAINKGEIKFLLNGKKLKGEFVLVRLKNDEKNWLLIKHKDAYAVNTIYNAEDQAGNGKASSATVASIRHGKTKKIRSFIRPMLASVTKTPFDDPEWIFEIKWDGYRAIAEIEKGAVKFYSRNGIDFSERFPSIANALKKIKHTVILDGEIVLLNEKNLPDFQKLQDYENHLNYPLVFYVFDILELDGKKMENLPLADRKKILKKALGKNSIIRYCDHIEGTGISFFEKAKEQGLEGIIAKKKESVYSEGYRSKEWLKIKNVQSTEVVIVGYTAPKGERKEFGSLVLANKKGKRWEYRGHVGTGFPEKLLSSLKKQMSSLETDQSPFQAKVPLNGDVTWLKPKLVADIAYTEITRDKIFRHPVFLRLREEKDQDEVNEEVVEEITDPKKNDEMKAGKYKVAVSNRHKIFWPAEGFTKGDVLDYYDKMADFILPHLKGRPLSLKRNPNGIRDEGFYHKDAGEHAPEYADVFKVKSGSNNKVIDYIVCNNKATLLYLVNLGCIEMNPWNSTTKYPDKPTWIVIDIDPSKKNSFPEVVDTALATKMILDKAGVKGYCKTSGASGLHVYISLKNKYDYTTVKDFAHIIASLVQEQLPKTTTLERSLSKRGDRIYVDFLQNRSGQTLASAYSLRPVPGATASAPLEWKEVNHSLQPSAFTIQNLYERATKKGDLFLPVITDQTSIPKALKALHV